MEAILYKTDTSDASSILRQPGRSFSFCYFPVFLSCLLESILILVYLYILKSFFVFFRVFSCFFRVFFVFCVLLAFQFFYSVFSLLFSPETPLNLEHVELHTIFDVKT